jgi:sugar phosphate isomerase/epimerase
VGHANLSIEGVESALETLAPRIKQFHLHDNHGAKDGIGKDEHLWPMATPEEGSIEWIKIAKKLSELPAIGTLEIAHSLEETTESVSAKAVPAFAMLEQYAQKPATE